MTKKIVKKTIQKANEMQKNTIKFADIIILHGKEHHPLSEVCPDGTCDRVREEYQEAKKRGEV